MTHIDFYILQDKAGTGREHLVCRLIEKVIKLKHQVYLHTDSAQHSAQLDDLLWTYKTDSFLPHALHQADEPSTTPIIIGHHEQAPDVETDVLINLSSQVPLFFSRFTRVAEVIDQQEDHANSGRERYRFYRDRGYPLKSHPIHS